MAEIQAYSDRERALLAELAATRGLVDKLLDQQHLLLNMVARLSGLAAPAPAEQPLQGRGSSAASLAVAAPQPQPERPATPPAVPPPASWLARPAGLPSAPSASSSADVPAPSSLADLFRSAAATAPNPSSAAAAASVAAAIAAVDDGDILSLSQIALPKPGAGAGQAQAPPVPAAAQLPLQPASLLFDTLGRFTVASGAEASSEAETGSDGAGEPAAELPVEVPKAAPTVGMWLGQRGETTLSAVLSFQASARLPETGVVDRPTWTALLGQEEAEQLFSRAPQQQPQQPQPAPTASPAAASVPAPGSGPAGSGSSERRYVDKWPVLMEGDGGREVHALQVALSNGGFYAGEDDMRWWQFGDTTLTALKFFQSCNGLPESGVCDERCWRALLGGASQPADLYDVRLAANSDDEEDGFSEDLEGVSKGRVWLLGEQRWERRA
ncbi:hypothetical protein GPECTOR_5g455 [Gonium pectorale]|uniref:Peptidoglycan binding-like domain-containing protein n=1 Tax=Gonium pectorale TaxID=33097 RepID=A0A150GWV3_GONPE|nr:hypothetical protein GPECTOR_5g455 [Gonium pectorale]|eukprot:KXZ54376.1 hypothetical protein GPECTOR_5g455 [Gonium pectorale]